MSLGLAFWILMLVWLAFGLVGGSYPYAGLGHTILLFILLGLLGWHTFGAPLK